MEITRISRIGLIERTFFHPREIALQFKQDAKKSISRWKQLLTQATSLMNSNKSSSIIVILFFISALGIGACGSGGGGGTSTPTEIIYTGKTDPVHITAEKANLLMANILNGPGNSASSKPSNAPTASQVLPRLLSRSFIAEAASARRTILQSSQTLMKTSFASAAPNPVNQTEDCGSSGTVTITGSINDDGTGTLKFHYVDCNEGDGFTTNGEATFQVDAVDAATGIILDGTIRSTALRTEDAFSEVIFNGSIRSQVLLSDQREILIVNGIFKDSRSAKLFKFESVVIVLVFDNYLNPTKHTETITGRIYDSVEGYVNIATQFPLIFSNEGLDFPDDGGPLVIIGAEGSRARLTVPSASKARIEVDADGDGIFETFAFYSWTNLTGAPSPNEPPTGIVTLSPSAPKRGDTLTATVTASDPEDNPITYLYAWTRNGTPIDGANTPTQGGNQFVKGDTIAVIVTLSDGVVSATITAAITIGDSPLVVEPATSVNAVYGALVAFQSGISDPDGDPVLYQLVYGPAGMQIDQTGKISWTPSGPMFDERMEIHFGVHATADGVTVGTTGTIRVTDSGHSRPLVRTGLRLPLRAGNVLNIADFNGDGKNEILVADMDRLLYTMVFDEENYLQDWVYPFDLTSGYPVDSVATHDITGDDNPDIIVGVGPRIIILDGVSRKIVGEISDGATSYFSIHVADIDKDGKAEIICLTTGSTFSSSSLAINVYDAKTLQLLWQAPYSNTDGASLTIGNVDNDPAIEIITSNGYVYDGATHANEWTYSPGFGFLIDTGDLDNDGIDEIVGIVDWQAIRIYSALSTSQRGEILLLEIDLDALLVANIDADPQAEILIGNGQWGDVTAYDGISRTVQWSINSQNHGVSSIAIGDPDNDGRPELVWTSGYTSSGPDSLVVGGLNPNIQVEWTNGSFSDWTQDALLQVDGPFIGGRWISTSIGQKRAVFASPSTNSGYDGVRLLGIDPTTGKPNVSSEVGKNLNHQASLDGVDYDGDGVDEVFLTTVNFFDGYFTAYDYGRNMPEWTSGLNIGTGVAVTHGDLNSDGHDDFITVTIDGYIHAYDVFNSALIWKSTQLPGINAFDIEVADLDGDGVLEIIAISTDHVLIYEKQENTFLLSMSIDVKDANQLAVSDLDRDGRPEIIVSSPNLLFDATESRIYIYDGMTFGLEGHYRLSGEVTELAVPPQGQGNLLIGAAQSYTYLQFCGSSKLIMVHGMTGELVWSSPPLIGEVQRNSLSFADLNNSDNQHLIFGTSCAMYLTR